MRVVIQRVKEASVSVDGELVGKISAGMLIFLGVSKEDQPDDACALVEKVAELRVFEDPQGKMNLSAAQVNGEFLIVSQFTLYGDCRKGRRPSFDMAADPQKGEALYLRFVELLRMKNFKVETGRFRAMMDVALVNDGPVTLIVDSRS
jgi:D-tyrosyl-tRNA(Tyr) deacylase